MIVGSGIVGCYLGKMLGEQEIWEKASRAMEKPCSSLLSKTGLDALDMDYSGCVLNELRGAKFFSDRRHFLVEKRTTQAYVLDRLALQKELAKEAEDEGCKIVYNKAWNSEKDEFILGADGALSSVARSMGVERRYIHAYQIRADLKETMDPDFAELYFGKLAPGFFGWRIPFDSKSAEIGLGVSRGNVKPFFDSFVKRFGVKKTRKIQSALIPVFDYRQKTVLGNKALVGDAAGQVKATTGGGIVFGCKCARVLAEAVERRDLDYYERGWRKRYGNDLRMHLKLRRFLDKIDYDELFSKISANNVSKLIEMHGDMDHPIVLARKLATVPAFWPYLPRLLFA